MTYPSPSTINASKGLGEVLNYINLVTDNWVSNLVLIGIYIIVLMGYYKAREDFAGGIAVAGFCTFIVGLLFWLGGFVTGLAFSFTLAIAIVGVIVILIDTNSN